MIQKLPLMHRTTIFICMGKKISNMLKKIKNLILSFILIFSVVFLSKTYLLPLFFYDQEYSYSDDEVKDLEQAILSNGTVKKFMVLFPESELFVTPQKYYRLGVSSTQFIMVKDVPYLKKYNMNLWLFFFVFADKNELKFKYCSLKIEFCKEGRSIVSYDIDKEITRQLITCKTRTRFNQYLMNNVFNPDGI